MRRQRPRNPVLLWATRSIAFRSRGPRSASAGGSERPRFTARAIDWVSWLAEVPVQDGQPAPPAEREPAAAPAASEIIEAVPGRSIRVSLKIRHTI